MNGIIRLKPFSAKLNDIFWSRDHSELSDHKKTETSFNIIVSFTLQTSFRGKQWKNKRKRMRVNGY